MKQTQRDRIIAKLRADGDITNVWAAQSGILRLSERMRELQELGWQFDADFVRVDGRKTATYRYSLTSRPKQTKTVYDRVVVDGVECMRPRLIEV